MIFDFTVTKNVEMEVSIETLSEAFDNLVFDIIKGYSNLTSDEIDNLYDNNDNDGQIDKITKEILKKLLTYYE